MGKIRFVDTGEIGYPLSGVQEKWNLSSVSDAEREIPT